MYAVQQSSPGITNVIPFQVHFENHCLVSVCWNWKGVWQLYITLFCAKRKLVSECISVLGRVQTLSLEKFTILPFSKLSRCMNTDWVCQNLPFWIVTLPALDRATYKHHMYMVSLEAQSIQNVTSVYKPVQVITLLCHLHPEVRDYLLGLSPQQRRLLVADDVTEGLEGGRRPREAP